MEQEIKTKNNSILPIVLVLIVLVILVGIWYSWIKKNVTPVPVVKPIKETKSTAEIKPKEDSVSAINDDLNKIESLNLDQEFKEIDNNLNSL